MKFKLAIGGRYKAYDPEDGEEFIFTIKRVDEDGDYVGEVLKILNRSIYGVGETFYVIHEHGGFMDRYTVTDMNEQIKPVIKENKVHDSDWKTFAPSEIATPAVRVRRSKSEREMDAFIEQCLEKGRIETVKRKIDEALDAGNKKLFLELTNELHTLQRSVLA